MGQNVNLAQQVAVQNVCCVFYYFCGGQIFRYDFVALVKHFIMVEKYQ